MNPSDRDAFFDAATLHLSSVRPQADDKAGGEAVAWIDPRDLEALASYSKQCQVVLHRESGKNRSALYTRPQPQADAFEFMEWRRVLAEKVDAYIQGESDGEGAGDEAYSDLKAHILAVPVAQPQSEALDTGLLDALKLLVWRTAETCESNYGPEMKAAFAVARAAIAKAS